MYFVPFCSSCHFFMLFITFFFNTRYQFNKFFVLWLIIFFHALYYYTQFYTYLSYFIPGFFNVLQFLQTFIFPLSILLIIILSTSYNFYVSFISEVTLECYQNFLSFKTSKFNSKMTAFFIKLVFFLEKNDFGRWTSNNMKVSFFITVFCLSWKNKIPTSIEMWSTTTEINQNLWINVKTYSYGKFT